MKIKIVIELPIYNCKCIIYLGDEIEKSANNLIKKNKLNIVPINEEDEASGLAFGSDTLDFYYIFLSTKKPISINTISHEICHIVDNVLEDRGVIDKEARAYLTGYITEKVFDFILKKKMFTHKYISPTI